MVALIITFSSFQINSRNDKISLKLKMLEMLVPSYQRLLELERETSEKVSIKNFAIEVAQSKYDELRKKSLRTALPTELALALENYAANLRLAEAESERNDAERHLVVAKKNLLKVHAIKLISQISKHSLSSANDLEYYEEILELRP